MRRMALHFTLLAGCGWLAGAAPQVLGEVDKQPPPVREQLAKHGILSDRQSLLGALKSRDAEVRTLAAIRLGEYDLDAMRGDSIPALAEALRTETDPAVASLIAAVLGGLGDLRGDRVLEKMCHDSAIGPRTKLQVARFLVGLKSENCVGDVLDLAFKGDDSVTAGVFDFLPRFQPFERISSEDQVRIIEIIRRGLSDPSPHMRLVASDVRGRMKDESAAADLQRAIDAESDAHVRDSMRRALIALQKRTPQ